MPQGKVKWYNDSKGFGFIEQDDGNDVFIHATALIGEGMPTLQEGQRVQYEIQEGAKGPKALNVIAL
jgi:CspA family cold shock protein